MAAIYYSLKAQTKGVKNLWPANHNDLMKGDNAMAELIVAYIFRIYHIQFITNPDKKSPLTLDGKLLYICQLGKNSPSYRESKYIGCKS